MSPRRIVPFRCKVDQKKGTLAFATETPAGIYQLSVDRVVLSLERRVEAYGKGCPFQDQLRLLSLIHI